MHRAFAAIVALLAVAVPTDARQGAKFEFLSRDSVLSWMDTYRAKPEPARLPAAVRELSRSGVLKDPETSGFYIGFIAGVLGANPRMADSLVARMTPLPASDQWAIVRAIAFSGSPEWKSLLQRSAARLPERRVMIEQYLASKLPVIDAIELDRELAFHEKIKAHFTPKPAVPAMSFSNNPELLDTLWGQYFATGEYRPVWRIMTLLPWSKDKDSVERLTVGSMAKVTLANNGARYPDLLFMMKDMAGYQPPEVNKILTEAIDAAETMQAPSLRKHALASIEDLKRKGPGYRRDLSTWGQIGQGAIGIGCIAAAAASLTALGLPCVIGGATASAALGYWANQ
jgi:hypothetical protein